MSENTILNTTPLLKPIISTKKKVNRLLINSEMRTQLFIIMDNAYSIN